MSALSDLIQIHGIRRDTWSTDYESALQIEGEHSEAATVDLTLERALANWEPIQPQMPVAEALKALEPLTFVDGVRRMHTRLFYEYKGQYQYSGLGTAVVGALQIQPGQMRAMSEALVIPPEVCRYVMLGALPEKMYSETSIEGIPHAFKPLNMVPSKEGYTSQSPVQALQEAMRDQEKHLVQRLRTSLKSGTVLVDGPLQKFTAETGVPVLGYVKTLHTQYLPTEQQAILCVLKAGQRSPIFRIGQRQISWYQRLAPLQPIDHPLTGLVRLELLSSSPLEHLAAFIDLADRLSLVLPLFVLESFKDARSPQNLMPIHALEQELKLRMGDERLLQRRIEEYLQRLYAHSDGVTHG